MRIAQFELILTQSPRKNESSHLELILRGEAILDLAMKEKNNFVSCMLLFY